MRSVTAIAVAPVRCFRLNEPEEVELTRRGVVENRRFYLADGDGRRLRSSRTAWPVLIRATYSAAEERLRLALPNGEEVEGSTLDLGETIHSDFSGRAVQARVVDGPWTEPLSELAGHPVRIARPDEPGLCQTAPVTLMSTASLDRLRREAGTPVDPRRFRMLFTIDGCDEHEEDRWNGRLLRIGQATVRVGGAVPRCAVTTRDPESGERDLDTLELIKAYRGVRNGGAIDFGVYAEVEQAGRVRVGDSAELV
jgi:uncharacterized protein